MTQVNYSDVGADLLRRTQRHSVGPCCMSLFRSRTHRTLLIGTFTLRSVVGSTSEWQMQFGGEFAGGAVWEILTSERSLLGMVWCARIASPAMCPSTSRRHLTAALSWTEGTDTVLPSVHLRRAARWFWSRQALSPQLMKFFNGFDSPVGTFPFSSSRMVRGSGSPAMESSGSVLRRSKGD